MMKYLSLILLCLSMSLFSQDEEASGLKPAEGIATQDVDVILGIDKVNRVDFVPDSMVQVGQPEVLAYKIAPAKKEIIFQGLRAGTSSVILRDASTKDIKIRFNVTVTATDQSKTVREIRELVGDVEGLEVGIKGEKVYVGGQLVVPSDIGKVVVVLDKYPEALRLVELSPHTQRLIAQRMQEEIQKNGMRDVTVRVVNGLFWLEGIVPSEGHEKKAFQIAQAYLPAMIESLALQSDRVKQLERPIIQNFLVVDKKVAPQPIKKLLKITAQFVELSKNYNRIFAFKWTPIMAGTGGSFSIGKSSEGGLTTSAAANSLSATISNLFPKLASAKGAGYARIIQSGILLVQDGIQGKINKSSSQSYSVGSGQFSQAQSAEAGFDLTVTPGILQQEVINLAIGLKVGALSGDSANPEKVNNEISTQITVKNKESAVVGGISVNKTGTNYDKSTPYGEKSTTGDTSSMPLFSFLRSKDHSVSRDQFVVFITPEILESASTGTEEIKKKFRKRGR